MNTAKTTAGAAGLALWALAAAWAPDATAAEWPAFFCMKHNPAPDKEFLKAEAEWVQRQGGHEFITIVATDWIDIAHEACIDVKKEIVDKMRSFPQYKPKRIDHEIAYFARNLVFHAHRHDFQANCEYTAASMGWNVTFDIDDYLEPHSLTVAPCRN